MADQPLAEMKIRGKCNQLVAGSNPARGVDDLFNSKDLKRGRLFLPL